MPARLQLATSLRVSETTRGERKERTRRAILDATLQLSGEQTLAALSLRPLDSLFSALALHTLNALGTLLAAFPQYRPNESAYSPLSFFAPHPFYASDQDPLAPPPPEWPVAPGWPP